MQNVPQLIKNHQTELNTLKDNSYNLNGKKSGSSKLQKKTRFKKLN